MKKINIGLIGLGRLGKEYGKNIAFFVRNANLLAVSSLEKEELDYARDYLEVEKTYLSFEEMLTNKDIDAIVILSPTNEHTNHIIKSLEAGFHVFSEKPLAINLEDCQRVLKEKKKYPNQIVMIGFVRRFDKHYIDAKKKIDENLVGKPFFVKSQTVDKDTWAPFQIEYCVTGGGMFHDFNVHDIDLAQWYLGSHIIKVWALGGAYRFKEFELAGDADNVATMCEMKNGTMAVLSASRVSSFGHNTYTEIIATKGNLKIGDPSSKNRVVISDKHGIRTEGIETFFERFEEAFLEQINYFVNCIIEKKQPDLTLENATTVTEVAIAMTTSFKKKKIIQID